MNFSTDLMNICIIWLQIQMSYAASSPVLSDKTMYPLFYRTYPPDSLFNPVRLALLKAFNWTRVAIIHETHIIFSHVRAIITKWFIRSGAMHLGLPAVIPSSNDACLFRCRVATNDVFFKSPFSARSSI